MPLVEIQNGTLADSTVINNNFDYLDDRITDTANRIYTNNAQFESQIATLNRALSTNVDNLEGEITTLQTSTTEQINTISGQVSTLAAKSIAPDYTRGSQVANGFVASTDGWLRCTARIDSYGSHVYINGVSVHGGWPTWLKDWSGWCFESMVPIAAGQTVTFDGNAYAYFFPYV